MGKRKSRRKKQNRQTRPKQTPITQTKFDRVVALFESMKLDTSRAISLSTEMHYDDLDESNHLYWALVKYVENVQDHTYQLDKMNRSILESLDEIPLMSEPEKALTWKNMIGMRIVLAHKSGDIRKDDLWETVVNDFPVLDKLLSQLVFGESAQDPTSPSFRLPAKRFLELPASQPGIEGILGNNLIMMSFDQRGKARCLRIAKRSNSEFVVGSPPDFTNQTISFTLLEDEHNKAEFLGKIQL